MKKMRVLNPKIEEIFKRKLNHNLFTKIKTMKPLVNDNCPESYIFFKTTFHTKTQPSSSKIKIYNFSFRSKI